MSWAVAENGYLYEQALRGSTAIPTSQGSKTSEAEHFSGVRPGVTMLAIHQSPEHQDFTHVYSGSVDCFRSASCGRPDPHAQDVSAVCTMKEAKWWPIRHLRG